MDNLFANLPERRSSEVIDALLEGEHVRVERIVSHGQSSPEGFWYDQDEAEWVTVLRGRARLQFEDDDEMKELGPGDHLHIPPHRRHRVEWTSPDEPTVWLAVFHAE